MKLLEITRTIIGESRYAGYPCDMVRFAGCNLNCSYCDTSYSIDSQGEEISIDHLIYQVHSKWVLVTGGEPLLQPQINEFLNALIMNNHEVIIETNGTQDITNIPHEVHVIMDVKTPSSGMSEHNNYSNFRELHKDDEIKFPIADTKDFDFALKLINDYSLLSKTHISMSPIYGKLEPQELIEWIKKSKLPIRLNLQLHKYLDIP